MISIIQYMTVDLEKVCAKWCIVYILLCVKVQYIVYSHEQDSSIVNPKHFLGVKDHETHSPLVVVCVVIQSTGTTDVAKCQVLCTHKMEDILVNSRVSTLNP